ncbi:MAG TPA: hypothetical protein VHF22_05860, partial [Planctomycetota bacterium]|nr:hypothetical protein [Planctomycetota bacterium]
DLRSASFFADFYLWMRYSVPSGDTETAAQLEKLEFMNGKADAREELDRKVVRGETYVCWRVSGTFHFDTQLRAYPFDTQALDIVIEQPLLEETDCVFKEDLASYGRSAIPPALWGAKEGLDIPEFTLKRTERRIVSSTYKTDFGDLDRKQPTTTYSRFIFSMKFARDFMPYIFKILIPLLVILAMAYLVFFLPPKEIQSASGLGISALLSAIAFNISIAQNLPEVGYLVVSDKFFIGTYLILLLTLGQSVGCYAWHDRDESDPRPAQWLRRCRYIFPVLYVSMFAYLLTQASFTR